MRQKEVISKSSDTLVAAMFANFPPSWNVTHSQAMAGTAVEQISWKRANDFGRTRRKIEDREMMMAMFECQHRQSPKKD